MAQTTYLGFVTTPSGKRLVMQSGTHAFTTSATECTMTIQMRRVAAAHVTPGQTVTGKSKTAMIGALIPYVSSTEQSATLAGTTTAYRIVVKRKTGSLSACKFAYHYIGW